MMNDEAPSCDACGCLFSECPAKKPVQFIHGYLAIVSAICVALAVIWAIHGL
jgi:hypothetical protein